MEPGRREPTLPLALALRVLAAARRRLPGVRRAASADEDADRRPTPPRTA